jgi:hypothetical protein
MSRKLILGLVFSGVVGLAGCSSKQTDHTSLPPVSESRDYSEYRHINASQRGQGDALGTSLASRQQGANNYVRTAGARPAARPTVAARPRAIAPAPVMPEPVLPQPTVGDEDLATIPAEE